MEILKHGADIEVLEPAALRKRVSDAIREAARRYALVAHAMSRQGA